MSVHPGQYARMIISDRGPTLIDNKPSITGGPTKLGVAYIVWDRLQRDSSGAVIMNDTGSVSHIAVYTET